jgi:hypothetical protein
MKHTFPAILVEHLEPATKAVYKLSVRKRPYSKDARHTLVHRVRRVDHEKGEVSDHKHVRSRELMCTKGKVGLQEDGLGGRQLPVPDRQLFGCDIRARNAEREDLATDETQDETPRP